MRNGSNHLQAETSLGWRLLLDASNANIEEAHNIGRQHIRPTGCDTNGLSLVHVVQSETNETNVTHGLTLDLIS
ncbi:hypothetical protein CSPAE12_04434 [Colletotrichum incanum]|nr:hypothetical protein CSPAE12_04434 [Colletotrichum incanum]